MTGNEFQHAVEKGREQKRRSPATKERLRLVTPETERQEVKKKKVETRPTTADNH